MYDVWPSPGLVQYMHFWRLLSFNGILPAAAKFTLRASLEFSYIGSVTVRHSSSWHQPNFVAWYKNGIMEFLQRALSIFGWAAITLGIGPHSSVKMYSCKTQLAGTGRDSQEWHWWVGHGSGREDPGVGL